MAKTAVIYNSNGEIAMVVHPDRDAQLDDPAFNPPGHVHVRLERAEYNLCREPVDVMERTRAAAIARDPRLAAKIDAEITRLKAERSR